jgi:uncharacterized membrane protein
MASSIYIEGEMVAATIWWNAPVSDTLLINGSDSAGAHKLWML